MARKGKKKKDPARDEGPADSPAETPAVGGDWSAAEASDREDEAILDADPAFETEEKAREFGLKDSPFETAEPLREGGAPVPVDEDAEEDFEPQSDRGKTQPPLGDEDSGLEEALGMEEGIVHIVDREDMGKGVQEDPSAYAQGPGKPGLVEGSTPAADTRDTFLDPAARAGQARASAEDVLKARGMAEGGDWSAAGAPPAPREEGGFSGAGLLDAILLDHHFPATKESIACALAQEAFRNGGPSEAFHDLVVQLDQGLFQDIHDLKRALGDRFTWETAHGMGHRGGRHGR